jgi:hypothetical protein
MLTGEGVGISKRLEDKERDRLRRAAKSLDLDGGGVIVRTAAHGAKKEDLSRELPYLFKWTESAVENQIRIHRFILNQFRHFPDPFPVDFSGKQIETQSLFCPDTPSQTPPVSSNESLTVVQLDFRLIRFKRPPQHLPRTHLVEIVTAFAEHQIHRIFPDAPDSPPAESANHEFPQDPHEFGRPRWKRPESRAIGAAQWPALPPKIRPPDA